MPSDQARLDRAGDGIRLDADRYRLQLQTLPSLRMFSLIDADMNMLRTTTALLGGAIGGADIMTAFAHDELSGASPMGRRMARMQQILMIEESGLGRSLDGLVARPLLRHAVMH